VDAARRRHLGRQHRIARPQQRPPPAARGAGQRRAEGAGADPAKLSMALTPSPAAAAAGSSAQRARGLVSRPSVNPATRRSAPAQAIIAPLSVAELRRRRDDFQAGSKPSAEAAPDGVFGGERRRDDEAARLARHVAKRRSPAR